MAKKPTNYTEAVEGDMKEGKLSDVVFGTPPPPPAGSAVVARPIPLEKIWADVRQPRREIPVSIRLVWNGDPADVPQLLNTWASVAANAAGRVIPIQDIILGNGEGVDTDGTPPIYASFISLLRLAGSILHEGLINPISIIDQRERHLIESGERRWLAHWLLRLYTKDGEKKFARIPAVTATGADFVWRQAAENTARRSLNAVGMARQLALLIMAARGDDQYHDYDQIVPSGGSDRRFYAQVADGNIHRIPKGAAERIEAAMGLSKTQLSQYRNLLRVTDDEEINDLLWLRGDIEDWPETAFRDANRLTIVNLRTILSRDSWSYADLRPDTLPIGKVSPPPSTPPASPPAQTPPVSTGQRIGNVDIEEARRVLNEIRQGFARVYALEGSLNQDEKLAADRATRLLNQAQGFYERNRLESAQESINTAFEILDEAADAADAAPETINGFPAYPAGSAPSNQPTSGGTQRPNPNTHDPYMTRIYHAWRSSFKDDDLLLITQDGHVYIAIGRDDHLLRNLRRDVQAGGIGLSGGADYTLVSKISAALLHEVEQQYSGTVLAFSYADLDEDMQYVAGVALRARTIPLNDLPSSDGTPASDNAPSDGSELIPIVDRTAPIFTVLTGIQSVASITGHPDTAETVSTLLGMTWGTAHQLTENGELDDTLQMHYDNIINALSAWSTTLSDFLQDLHEQLAE